MQDNYLITKDFPLPRATDKQASIPYHLRLSTSAHDIHLGELLKSFEQAPFLTTQLLNEWVTTCQPPSDFKVSVYQTSRDYSLKNYRAAQTASTNIKTAFTPCFLVIKT